MATGDLIQHVYASFLSAYRQGASGSTGGELLGFEPIGFAPGCVAVPAPGMAAAALQEISQIADALPQLDGGVLTRTLRTLSGQYAVILDVAKPTSADSLAAVTDLQSQAGRIYHDAPSDGELDGPKATFATPPDWYDLTNTTNWTSYSYDSTVQASAPAPPTPPVPKVQVMWRVVTPQMRALAFPPAQVEQHPPAVNPALFLPGVEATHPLVQTPARPIPRFMPLAAHQVTSHTFSESIRPIAAAAAVTAPGAPLHLQFAAIDFTSRAAVAHLATQTASQPVETQSFKVSFDYCVVRLRRPWLSGDFLTAPGWHIPGQHGGDYATGVPANIGWLAAIPTAFIAVRRLTISGAWSANDAAAAGNSAAFGPFSLGGISATERSSVSNPGLQVIAWVCDMQPRLPPDSDPSLPVPVKS